jgi:hypothetical protein
MLETLHMNLKSNVQSLEIASLGAQIGCPACHINPMVLVNPRLECEHVCGVMFPEWKDATRFEFRGKKLIDYACPCIIYGKDLSKSTFWEYINSIKGV